jgi:hypothetical protein
MNKSRKKIKNSNQKNKYQINKIKKKQSRTNKDQPKKENHN